jgi:hypothetical protein
MARASTTRLDDHLTAPRQRTQRRPKPSTSGRLLSPQVQRPMNRTRILARAASGQIMDRSSCQMTASSRSITWSPQASQVWPSQAGISPGFSPRAVRRSRPGGRLRVCLLTLISAETPLRSIRNSGSGISASSLQFEEVRCALIAAAARTRVALSAAGWPSGRTVVSSRPVRMPWPRSSARLLTAQLATPLPWCTCSSEIPAATRISSISVAHATAWAGSAVVRGQGGGVADGVARVGAPPRSAAGDGPWELRWRRSPWRISCGRTRRSEGRRHELLVESQHLAHAQSSGGSPSQERRRS